MAARRYNDEVTRALGDVNIQIDVLESNQNVAYEVMAYIVMAYIVMAYVHMADIVMAYIVMAYEVMAYIVMVTPHRSTS